MSLLGEWAREAENFGESVFREEIERLTTEFTRKDLPATLNLKHAIVSLQVHALKKFKKIQFPVTSFDISAFSYNRKIVIICYNIFEYISACDYSKKIQLPEKQKSNF